VCARVYAARNLFKERPFALFKQAKFGYNARKEEGFAEKSKILAGYRSEK